MGIASTLIIVRVSLGIAIHNEKTFKETILRNQDPSLNVCRELKPSLTYAKSLVAVSNPIGKLGDRTWSHRIKRGKDCGIERRI
ncbi:hypothetical protein PM082_022009 [Marasmius tenuissimus]|nr:hypothetical protein PM082_022009 [Marasmius tenuissimus]